GSPGRLIDLDQEYSAGASARTAAGGTPQVPLAPRLASDARPPSRSPQAEGPPRAALLRPRGRPGTRPRRPSPPGGTASASGDPRAPLPPETLPAPRSSPGGGALSARRRFFWKAGSVHSPSTSMATSAQYRQLINDYGPPSLGYTQGMQGTSSSQVPQSKYAELLAIIEELGKEIRPTYAGSKSAMERLKRGIIHARGLVRECLAETERNARS
uniref:Cyclin dependent kinase 2 associated protein 1 n=1 Tax=Calidris pygmaea TaxID=425635 RepID=A0A8C3J8T4_9CHAR